MRITKKRHFKRKHKLYKGGIGELGNFDEIYAKSEINDDNFKELCKEWCSGNTQSIIKEYEGFRLQGAVVVLIFRH